MIKGQIKFEKIILKWKTYINFNKILKELKKKYVILNNYKVKHKNNYNKNNKLVKT